MLTHRPPLSLCTQRRAGLSLSILGNLIERAAVDPREGGGIEVVIVGEIAGFDWC